LAYLDACEGNEFISQARYFSLMDIVEVIRSRAFSNRARIAIGVGVNAMEIVRSAEASSEFADVVLVGSRRNIGACDVEVVDSDVPHQTLVELLASGEVDGVVRGNLASNATLGALRKQFNLQRLHRISLLLSAEGVPFFFAPVGIDEANSLTDKLALALRGCEFIKRFGITPSVGVLSGGRLGDVGRSERVDRSLAEGEFVTMCLRRKGVDAEHYTVLVEDAVGRVNFILAPDGISGNLMYRSLVFLGGGDGFGAPVLMDGVFVDSSRAKGDYTKPIMMASALAKGF
jgi:putative methanogen marker protein 4